MNMKSKFTKKAEDFYKKNNSNYKYYLDLQKFGLERFKFEKENKDYLLDILPYKIETNKHPDFGKSEFDYHFEVWTHNYIGINKDSYLCVKKMFNQECAICNEFERLKTKLEKDGLSDKELWDEISHLAFKQRMIYHILYDAKKYVLDLPLKTFEKTWKESLDKKKKRGIELFPIYLNEADCTSLEFSYKGKGKFYDLVNYDFPLIENYDKKHVENLVSLEKLLVIPDQEEIKNNLLGNVENESEEQETETKEESYAEVVENEPEQDVEIHAPKKKKKKVSLNECPKELEFGKKWDEYEWCDECKKETLETWNACKKIYDAL